MCTEKTFADLFANCKEFPGQQVQKYHRTLFKGLMRNQRANVVALSKRPLSRRYAKKMYFKSEIEQWESSEIIYLPYINIPIINNLLQYISTKREIKRLFKKGYTYAIIDVLNTSMNIGVISSCQKYGIKLLGIITDIPQFLSGNKNSLGVRIGNYIISKCDSYVLLTEQMNDLVNRQREKPYVVIEGQIDDDVIIEEMKSEEEHKEKICLYSGSLDRVNGIQYLTEGFIKANLPNTELHIYGGGDFKDELLQICLVNPNVIYFGNRMNNEVVEAQKKADLLINPRPTDQEFVKYSFPSKNMEYMASGTPLLTTRLLGMPEEYNEFVYFLDDETADGVANTLKSVFSKNIEERRTKGKAAQKFVVGHKKGSRQSDKVFEMITSELSVEKKP